MDPSNALRAPSSKTGERASIVALAMLVSCSFCMGCSGNKNPSTLPPQTVTRVTPELEEPPPPLPPPIREVQATRPKTLTVIDPGGQSNGEPGSLLEASALAKAQKENVAEPVANINDENLSEYAKGGDVIMLDSDPAGPDPSDYEEPQVDTRSQDPRDESYWREGVLEIRMGWRRTVDMIKELELENAAMRQEFYTEEDPYLRDSQIKPAWDRVLDRLDELRERAVRSEQELNRLISDGMRAGVPQGWLNQGWELEPSEAEKASLRKLYMDGEIKTHEAADIPSADP